MWSYLIKTRRPRKTFAGAVIYAVLCLLKVHAQSSSSTCETVTVSGGASPGTYVNSGLVFEGKEAWIQTQGGEVVAVLRYLDGIVRQRRLEGELSTRGIEGPPEAEVEEILEDGDVFFGAIDAFRDKATTVSRRSLVMCASGFWISLLGPGSTSSTEDIVYPVYIAADCAYHPADITTDWLSLGCASCELEEAVPTISVNCSLDSLTPSPLSTVVSPSPVTDITPPPTVTDMTPPPTSAMTLSTVNLETPSPATTSVSASTVTAATPPPVTDVTSAPTAAMTPPPTIAVSAAATPSPVTAETLPPISETTPFSTDGFNAEAISVETSYTEEIDSTGGGYVIASSPAPSAFPMDGSDTSGAAPAAAPIRAKGGVVIDVASLVMAVACGLASATQFLTPPALFARL